MPFTNLNRQFRDLTEKELEDPEFLASLSEWHLGGAQGWKDLTSLPRVLIFAEAGSGKTAEMQEQAAQMFVQDMAAFFLPLESLDHTGVRDLLAPGEQARFDRWHRTESEEAWFFLDAVDELKLTNGKLDRALVRFAQAVAGRLADLHVVISCRPYDWRRQLDMETLQNRLPVLTQQKGKLTGDEFFLELLSNTGKKARKEARKTEKKNTAWKIVILLPLSNPQIHKFVAAQGANNYQGLMEEIDARDAWTFARRPLDLMELISYWNANSRLGTRAEQHELNVASKLLESPDRPDPGHLSADEAKSGAERLALAMALTRTRTLRAPDTGVVYANEAGVLDPATILTDWPQEKQNALLGRALFIPATYGRIRFHHRSVQEYLAALALRRLRQDGMTMPALHRLLFAERYGIELVLPSMQAISAWLALFNESVRNALVLRAPEILLSEGDPESLDIGARARIIEAFAKHYGKGGWRGIRIDQSELRRLSDPRLGDTIRALWAEFNMQMDVGSLLIDLVLFGKISALSDLMSEKALNPEADSFHRIMAVSALLACGATAAVESFKEVLLAHPEKFEPGAVHRIVVELFPRYMTVSELITLVSNVPESERVGGGFGWNLRTISESIESANPAAAELRERLADLLWQGRHKQQQEWLKLRSRYAFVIPALTNLCLGQLETQSEVSDSLIFAATIANRFRAPDTVSFNEKTDDLRAAASKTSELKRRFFWEDVKMMDQLVPCTNPATRLFQVLHEGIVTRFDLADWGWLLDDLENAQAESKSLVFRALIDVWNLSGRSPEKLGQLRAATANSVELRDNLEAIAAPAQPNPEAMEMQRHHAEQVMRHSEEEAKRLEGWKVWREEVLANPAVHFANDKLFMTLFNFYKWQQSARESETRYNIWNNALISRGFNAEVAELVKVGLSRFWRTAEIPPLWSERTNETKGQIQYAWIIGLCAVALEASEPGWTRSLTDDEIKRALVYATIEINGLPPFVSELVSANRAAVLSVLAPELQRQLDGISTQLHLPLLQDIGHAEPRIKELVSPVLIEVLSKWPLASSEQAASAMAGHLGSVLTIISETGGPQEFKLAAEIIEAHFNDEAWEVLKTAWLRGLFAFDAEKAVAFLLARLNDDDLDEQGKINLISKIIGDVGDRGVDIPGQSDRARVLGKLIRALPLTRRGKESDVPTTGEATPHENLMRMRESLLGQLLSTPGPIAQAEIRSLVGSASGSVSFPERTLHLARNRAAQDAEFLALTPNAFRQLERQNEAPPNDTDSLFTTMWDRLTDLQETLWHSDFSDIDVLAGIKDEDEMQRSIAGKLASVANGAYQITRESEVIAAKKTDLHFSAPIGSAKGVIEIKLAEKWSFNELLEALEDQLLGRYLRDPYRKAGILLVTYGGTDKSSWKETLSSEVLPFELIIARLAEKARFLEAEFSSPIRLGVFGLDLRESGSNGAAARSGTARYR